MNGQNQAQISVDDFMKVTGEQYWQLRIANQTIMELRLEIERLKKEKDGKKEKRETDTVRETTG